MIQIIIERLIGRIKNKKENTYGIKRFYGLK